MDSSKMKVVCSVCRFYRTIVYAEGACAMGCLKASEDGEYPVDIRHLDACPRDQKKRKKVEIEPAEMLKALGYLYAQCAPHESHLSLHQYLSECHPSIKRYKSQISRTIIDMGLLTVVYRGNTGKRGNTCTYRWNMETYGPPSLELVDKIIQTVSTFLADQNLQRRAEAVTKEPPKFRVLEVDEGVTSCDVCWLKDCPDCHEKLVAMGLDCKKMNINTIRYGKSTVG